MGTSMSSKGSNGSSPLVPSWAAPDGNAVPSTGGQRFRSFRIEMGRAAGGGGRGATRKALGHYARSAVGGAAIGTARHTPTTTAGASLWGVLQAVGTGETGQIAGVNIDQLIGQPVDQAIDQLVAALTPANGDGERIRAAMQEALAHALQDVEVFDQAAFTEDVIRSTLIEFLALAIFNHIVAESGDAFDKAADPTEAMMAQNDLKELVRAVVEANAASVFPESMSTNWNAIEAQRIQSGLVEKVLTEWEGYES